MEGWKNVARQSFPVGPASSLLCRVDTDLGGFVAASGDCQIKWVEALPCHPEIPGRAPPIAVGTFAIRE